MPFQVSCHLQLMPLLAFGFTSACTQQLTFLSWMQLVSSFLQSLLPRLLQSCCWLLLCLSFWQGLWQANGFCQAFILIFLTPGLGGFGCPGPYLFPEEGSVHFWQVLFIFQFFSRPLTFCQGFFAWWCF